MADVSNALSVDPLKHEYSAASSPLDPIDAAHLVEMAEDLKKISEAEAGEDGGDVEDERDDTSPPDQEAWDEKRRKTPLVVGWKDMDFEHFKNRYSPNDGFDIIEVLRGHQYLGQEIWKESLARDKKPRRGDNKWKRNLKSSSGDNEMPYIQRIRIQSPAILRLLSRLSGHHDNWAIDKPRVFFRPFRVHYYYLPQMKEALSILEKRWSSTDAEDGQRDTDGAGTTGLFAENNEAADSEASSVSEDAEDDSDDFKGPDPETAVTGDVANSVTAMHHVKKYIEFVEENIVPLWKTAQGITKRKVAFLDLWMSFKPGEILYCPPASDSSQGLEIPKAANKMYQNAWRLYSMVLDSYEDDVPNDTQVKKNRELCLYCYYIDYNGTSYGPVKKRFDIRDYEGEKDISQLSIYPLRFAKDRNKVTEMLQKQGEHFQFIKTEKYLFYDGWTLTQGPTGETESSKTLTSEHIDSHVIVDFVEGYKADSSLSAPSFEGLQTFDDSDWSHGDDRLEIRHWSQGAQSDVLGYVKEVTQRSEWFGNYLRSQHIRENKFIKAWKSGTVTELDPEDLVLLPRRAVTYAFRERKFVLADIHSLKEVRKQGDVFRDLKIAPDHKTMIESLVRTHFEKQAMQKQHGAVDLNQDLIRGKGSGLVLLLHGVPGVGKTATAEAIAQINSKPLFTITCGDLGFIPKDVDESLREIFRLAHLWDCVLLLDEADVFLSSREVYDLKRNALVSVFLRVLEYYSGILFLTTNRVGHLDEAFKSRIHISLYYPPLSEEQTVAIFDVNIKQLSNIEAEKQQLMNKEGSTIPRRPKMSIDRDNILEYARWHWRNHQRSERWNGRQIRNAFQIAYSLAHWPNKKPAVNNQARASQAPSPPQPPPVPSTPATTTNSQAQAQTQKPLKLDWTHFETVARVIEKFDAYLYDTTAGTAADNARDAGTRADEHDPNSVKHHEYRPPSYAQTPAPQPPNRFRPRFKPSQGGGASPAGNNSFAADADGGGPYGNSNTYGGGGGKRLSQSQQGGAGALPPRLSFYGAARGGGRGAAPPPMRGKQPSGPPRGKGRGAPGAGSWQGEGFHRDGGWSLEPQPPAEEYYQRSGGGGGGVEMGGEEYYQEHEEGIEEQEHHDEQGHYEEHADGNQYDQGYEYHHG